MRRNSARPASAISSCTTSSARASGPTARRSRSRSRSPSPRSACARRGLLHLPAPLSGEFLEPGVPDSSQHGSGRRGRRAGRRQSSRPSHLSAKPSPASANCTRPRPASLLKTPRGEIEVMNPHAYADHFGTKPPDTTDGARLAALRFSVRDLAAAEAIFKKAAIPYAKHGPARRRPGRCDGRELNLRFGRWFWPVDRAPVGPHGRASRLLKDRRRIRWRKSTPLRTPSSPSARRASATRCRWR